MALDRKDWSGAETLARDALPLSQGIGKLDYIAHSSHSLAYALVRQGKKADALPHAKHAVEIYDQLGMRVDVARARETLAKCEEKAAPEKKEQSHREQRKKNLVRLPQRPTRLAHTPAWHVVSLKHCSDRAAPTFLVLSWLWPSPGESNARNLHQLSQRRR